MQAGRMTGGFRDDPKHNTNDGKVWLGTDIADLKALLKNGGTVDEAAHFLCRVGTVDDVQAKARELGLSVRRK